MGQQFTSAAFPEDQYLIPSSPQLSIIPVSGDPIHWSTEKVSGLHRETLSHTQRIKQTNKKKPTFF